ncbi:histone-lysine N-methyltransferase family member SUVH9-like [Lycium barbarum]|uniref:histone-lysine N-methyltransferase family member SUVH9-like n=1 Tax=Lycium barbarum TaxID=112863 RepID=UPI00293E36B6|nr:histone-lysine N-methyltransferase family member SUVH9-like [Lycium barbarum]XP_060214491.1 histone-lysine N-methyltransferase family member SUVH9-like [Lycium barbarum]XP_060214492.1 histone-lysine N-methyltransferase family member SUVH9-like [Lycium barbarum]XP_060214493.1 histone-lysine N-methyltransferase family member SUVH9-like [Lycium barbarum]XP_060214494.1 histone-lysine N-methyltransferase family member SUVH9-like [Lycium barbarum]XP_060214495.1 histone-lysine N-methyltransferase 
MGSLVPFQDLNLQLETTNFTSSPIPTPRIFPMIEPKLEPLDEYTQADLQTTPFFSNPSPNFNNSGSSSAFTPTQQLRTSDSIPPEIPPGFEETYVYSEFKRISDQYKEAFAGRMQHFGDVEVFEHLHSHVEVVEDPDSHAIVSVNNDTQASEIVIARKRYPQRSSELVRVTDLKPEDQRYHRDAVRRTRMLFDSLRILSNNQHLGPHRRRRGDLRACKILREHGLWMHRDKRIVGAIPGVLIGDVFFFRMELCVVGLHGQSQAGIDYVPASQSSIGEPIATSVIVSGGYEDNQDGGDVIIHAGQGGQDKHTRQCVHQKLECGNLALERSMHYGVEVRVIRVFKYEGSGNASGDVYVYDGLYRIVEYCFDIGKAGFGVYKFKLVRIENQEEMGSAILRFAQNLRIRPLVARPTGYVSLDISRKKENVPVFLFNDIDDNHDPVYFDYLVKTVYPPFVYQNVGSGNGCECIDGCGDNCFCAMRNGGQFSYDNNGILLRGKPLVFECGPHCLCPPTCQNRVSQKGLRNRFEVFRSRETGWGVRTLDLIQAGSFIFEFTGVVLTREQAQIFTMNGDSLVYPSRFPKRWAEWGDLSQIYPNYVRSAYPSIPPLDFAMDVSRMRNLACYIRYSSSPNAMVQPMLYDHNHVSFPHLMLFAMENIPPLKEISIDYGVADEWTGKLGHLRLTNLYSS